MNINFRISISALLIAVSALSAACLSCSGEKPVRKSTFVMGTRATISIFGLSAEDAEESAGKAFHELHRLEQMMSTWNPESEITELNSSPGAPVRLSGELIELIDISKQFSALTSGAFDITARPLSRLWGFQDGAGSIPSDRSIKRTLDRIGYEKIKIEGSSVTLPQGVNLDLGGIAKGYGVDICVQILREEGVSSALIDLGGNIFAIGSPPGKKGWIVGIRNPVRTDSIIGYAILRDEAVASSGNYENFVERDGKKFGHIIDPRTGRPVSGSTRGVTVIAPTATSADALSTSLFVLGPEEGTSLCAGISISNPPDSLPYLRKTAEQGYLRRTGNYADAIFVTVSDHLIHYYTTGNLSGKVFLNED